MLLVFLIDSLMLRLFLVVKLGLSRSVQFFGAVNLVLIIIVRLYVSMYVLCVCVCRLVYVLEHVGIFGAWELGLVMAIRLCACVYACMHPCVYVCMYTRL